MSFVTFHLSHWLCFNGDLGNISWGFLQKAEVELLSGFNCF